jgi:hypothetical protein
MLSLSVWVIGLALMAVVLARAWAGRFVFAYPLFYTYLSFVLLTSSGLLFIYSTKPSQYARFYWYIEFAGAVLGCAVVWEIYRRALGRFPGAARMARNVLLLTLALAVSKALADTASGTSRWPSKTLVALERDLRGVQAGGLVGLLAVLASYRIPLGKNLRGMMLGYGLLIGSNVVTLTFRELLGNAFQATWSYLQPLAYVTALLIWCASLWSYQPVPLPCANARIEHDYQSLVRATSKGLLEARSYLRKALRS